MLAGTPKQSYTREEALRVVGISERQLRGWERQELVPALEQFAFADLIALRSLQKLHASRVPPARIRNAVRALREKLHGVENPLKELKVFCEGRRVAVLLDGQKMEPVSGQLLLDFDHAELTTLLAFPPAARQKPAEAAAKIKEAEKWFERGLELEETGAPPEEIVEAYQTALELDPSSAGAAVNLGTVFYHLHKWEEAERAYRKALEIDSAYALAHFNLGNLFDERGRRDAGGGSLSSRSEAQSELCRCPLQPGAAVPEWRRRHESRAALEGLSQAGRFEFLVLRGPP